MSDDPQDFDEQAEVKLIERMNYSLDKMKEHLQKALDETKNLNSETQNKHND
jgi:hypothetical protein